MGVRRRERHEHAPRGDDGRFDPLKANRRKQELTPNLHGPLHSPLW